MISINQPEKLLSSSLVRSEASHFSDEVSHKLVVLGQLSLGLAWLSLQGILGGLVTFLKTNTDLVPWSHYFCNNFNLINEDRILV